MIVSRGLSSLFVEQIDFERLKAIRQTTWERTQTTTQTDKQTTQTDNHRKRGTEILHEARREIGIIRRGRISLQTKYSLPYLFYRVFVKSLSHFVFE